LIAVWFVATFGLSPAAAEERAAPYDVLSYRLVVAIDFAENPGPESPYRSLFSVLNTMTGEATIRVRNVSARAQEEISLILHRLMEASEIGA
ncbi:hypothetical protein, partial [Escherichia coli]|uniref:hypothetical protein n=1 Tax=Escherichia coli TaxID=562 RepID=UPI001412E82B